VRLSRPPRMRRRISHGSPPHRGRDLSGDVLYTLYYMYKYTSLHYNIYTYVYYVLWCVCVCVCVEYIMLCTPPARYARAVYYSSFDRTASHRLRRRHVSPPQFRSTARQHAYIDDKILHNTNNNMIEIRIRM